MGGGGSPSLSESGSPAAGWDPRASSGGGWAAVGAGGKQAAPEAAAAPAVDVGPLEGSGPRGASLQGMKSLSLRERDAEGSEGA